MFTREPAACALEQEFPGVVVWHGTATGSWWALVHTGRIYRLVEALDPRELRDAIWNAHSWPWPPHPRDGAPPATFADVHAR